MPTDPTIADLLAAVISKAEGGWCADALIALARIVASLSDRLALVEAVIGDGTSLLEADRDAWRGKYDLRGATIVQIHNDLRAMAKRWWSVPGCAAEIERIISASMSDEPTANIADRATDALREILATIKAWREDRHRDRTDPGETMAAIESVARKGGGE